MPCPSQPTAQNHCEGPQVSRFPIQTTPHCAAPRVETQTVCLKGYLRRTPGSSKQLAFLLFPEPPSPLQP